MATLGLVVFWDCSGVDVEHRGHWEQYLGTALPKTCLSAEGVWLHAPMGGDSLLHPSRSPWLGLICQLCCGELFQHPAYPQEDADPPCVDPMLQTLPSSL